MSRGNERCESRTYGAYGEVEYRSLIRRAAGEGKIEWIFKVY